MAHTLEHTDTVYFVFDVTGTPFLWAASNRIFQYGKDNKGASYLAAIHICVLYYSINLAYTMCVLYLSIGLTSCVTKPGQTQTCLHCLLGLCTHVGFIHYI